MSTNRSLLHWVPRLLGILYVAFISLFAFDVWGMGGNFRQELAAFLVHLLPAYLIAGALIVAWRRPWLGGILFLLLATGFGLFFGRQEVSTLLLMAVIPTIIGLLFLADGCLARAELRPRL